MDGAVGMTSLVGDDLPFGRGADNYIGTSDSLATVSRVALRTSGTSLTEPCQADSRACIAGAE